MNYQHLSNFIQNHTRRNDIYVPSMLTFLIKNGGWGTKEQVAKLIYIFEHKHDLDYYETIVDKFASVILEEYNIIIKEEEAYKLRTWPLTDDEIEDLSIQCLKVSNGFFRNLEKKAS